MALHVSPSTTAMEWLTAPLAKKGSRHGVPYYMPPMIGPLKYLAESLVISVDQWKPLQLRVTDILSLLQMTTAITPILASVSPRMTPWGFLRPGMPVQRRRLESLSRSYAQMGVENICHKHSAISCWIVG